MKCLMIISLVMLGVIVGVTADMSDEFKSLIMDRHNEYRKDEKARYMNKLEWSDDLQSQAELYVSFCNYDSIMDGPGYNVAYYSNFSTHTGNMYRAMEDWYSEREDYYYNANTCGSSCRYTQMIWYNTQRVGCAYNQCSTFRTDGQIYNDYWYFACFYDPRGNMMGEFPYIVGKSCEDCEKCEDGLCIEGPKDCQDLEDDCEKFTMLCYNIVEMQEWCKKTCGFC